MMSGSYFFSTDQCLNSGSLRYHDNYIAVKMSLKIGIIPINSRTLSNVGELY